MQTADNLFNTCKFSEQVWCLTSALLSALHLYNALYNTRGQKMNERERNHFQT